MLRVTVDWIAVPVCGVLGGLLGALFSLLVVQGTTAIGWWLAPRPMGRTLLLAAACGLIVALCGIASAGATYGTGYEAARSAIEGQPLAATFAPLKFIATTASTLSGIPGGLFAPSLSVGAGLGGIVAHILGVNAVGPSFCWE